MPPLPPFSDAYVTDSDSKCSSCVIVFVIVTCCHDLNQQWSDMIIVGVSGSVTASSF